MFLALCQDTKERSFSDNSTIADTIWLPLSVWSALGNAFWMLSHMNEL